MYKLHLIRKYLLTRRIAWVALVAVMLCTAMVLVVFSVMNGWLETFKGSFHGSTGDVVISARDGLAGFRDYAAIVAGVSTAPGVVAAVPTISNYGLIDIRGGGISMVHVIGYPPDVGRVVGFPSLLHRQHDEEHWSFGLLPDVPYESQFRNPTGRKRARSRPGMIVSGPVVGITHASRDPDYTRMLMVQAPTSLTLLPVSANEGVEKGAAVTVPFWIVDDVRSRVYALDAQNVYVAFDELQRDLKMDASDLNGPARCTDVLVKAEPGADLKVVCAAVGQRARKVADRLAGRASPLPSPDDYPFAVQTWEDQQGSFIKAVQNEVVITTVLFGVISLVAVLLIFCIFYMIVVEKTRDIGVIKSVGATGGGVLALFLGYGLAIGLVGAAAGVGLAFAIVRNINELHAWLGRTMGITIWSPETYQFDSIPSRMEGRTVAYTVSVALVAAVLGALLPAVRAAGMNPVDSLRYE